MRLRALRINVLPAAVAALALTACDLGEDPVVVQSQIPGVVFVAQSQMPNAFMEALYFGKVVKDASGCLRLGERESATVVWPFASRIKQENGGLAVYDARGGLIGKIGSDFRFGGGFVQSLHDGIPLTAADRKRATSTCPGSYWVVGEVYAPGK